MSEQEKWKFELEEYIRQGEPSKVEKSEAWRTAIGLQAVDGLKTSEYLLKTAVQNIEGEITVSQASELIDSYYKENPSKSEGERVEEADKVSARIAEILSEKTFSFTPSEYIGIHRKLFLGIYKHAGKIRDYNITKKEWVLNGATVLYGSATELRATLEYDFSQERKFSYQGLNMDETIQHLAFFISRLWQIHIFGEGNTRTTAVFLIKYIRKLGFDVTNDMFAENAWYFRNAMVRANYTNLQKGIHETTEYLELFLRNLLLNENNELKNRYMHISNTFNKKVDISDSKVDIDDSKVDIDNSNFDLISKKEVFEQFISNKAKEFSPKTQNHILQLFEKFGYETVFGRTEVCKILDLQPSSVSKLFSKLLKTNIIISVSGCGKGKYKFIECMKK